MVTHKGASADSGHYIGFARADVVNGGSEANFDEDHDQWIKFDDDKVRKKRERKLMSVLMTIPLGVYDDRRQGGTTGRRRRRICGVYSTLS